VETRGIFLVTAALVVMIACSVLAAGWMDMADQAVAATARCEARQRKRVLDLPRISVDRDIKFRGLSVARSFDLHIDSPMMKFEPLLEVLQADHMATSTCDANLACVDNLLALETADTVPSDVLNLVVRTAWAAGYDVVIVPRRDTW
jgi:hypothetical protein